MTSINIETLILVAVWKQPAVFQGYFKFLIKTQNMRKFCFSDVSAFNQLRSKPYRKKRLHLNIICLQNCTTRPTHFNYMS